MKDGEFQPVIGLEIHVQLHTKSKMFCSCLNDPLETQPNVNVCEICMGHPGTLPVINKEAIKKVLKVGMALNCHLNEFSQFDRKNYFYPDLPKGYQISQYKFPLCERGFLEIGERKIRIKRIHLEEDTGKLIHKKDYSLVDFNRAGIPLMELVTEPDITSPEQAKRFAKELQLILRYLQVSEADMEKGQMRVEANISLKRGEENFPKTEIKNLNSFKAVEKALEFEIKRQTEILKSNKKLTQTTRGWDEINEVTVEQREKEKAHDYRYFPEPDLPPVRVDVNRYLKEIVIPELPSQRRERFKREYGLKEKEVEIFVENKELGEYFEKVCSELREWVKEIEMKEKIEREEFLKLVKICANYIITDLQGLLKGKSVKDEDFLITPENFGEFVAMIYEGKISSKIAKQILEEMFLTGADPSSIVEKKGLSQISDEGMIEKIAKKIIQDNPQAVQDYKNGKQTALQFLVGQIMRETKGRANPQLAQTLLKKLLQ